MINLILLHEYGYLLSDIKESNKISLNNPKIIYGEIIDFSRILNLKYINEEGKYLGEVESLKACENFYYASINALKFKCISRKDDLES